MSKYTVKEGQSIFDVTNNTYGSLNYVYQLMLDNNIPDLFTLPVNQDVTYTPPEVTPPTVNSGKPPELPTNEVYKSVNGQNIFDVCVQTYGSLGVMYKLLQDSNFANLLTVPFPGTSFNFNPQLIKDKIFSSYLKRNGLIIATGGSQQVVFGTEDLTTIFVSEDGKTEFTFES